MWWEKDPLSKIQTGNESRFGQSTLSEFERYVNLADDASIRGTQFVLEGRPFNDYFAPQLEFANPVISPLLKSESSILSKKGAEMVVSNLDIPDYKGDPTDNTAKALSYLERHYKGINVIKYNTVEEGAKQNRLFHSKVLLTERDGKEFARLDTAPYATFSFFGLTAGPQGIIKGKKDVFYETSNPLIVSGAKEYYEDVKQGKIVSKRYNEVVIAGNEIIPAITRDIQSTSDKVIIHSASITLNEFKSKNAGYISPEDKDQYRNMSMFLDTLITRGEEGKETYVYSDDNYKNFKDAANALQNAGITVLFPDKRGRQPLHYNLFYMANVKGEEVVYVTTRRASEASHEELAFRLTSSIDPLAVNYFQAILESDVVNEKALEEAIQIQAMKDAGVDNKQLSPFFISGDNSKYSYLIPSAHGASHFYAKALYNSERMKGGQSRIPYTQAEGYATAAYRFTYLGQHGVMPSSIPGYIKQYDKEMAIPGLGTYINEYALLHGYGRLYKDEMGAIPSLFGIVGAVLDRSINYYSFPLTPDEERDVYSIDPTRMADEGKTGFFEALFTSVPSSLLQTTLATFTYFAFGMPYGTVMGELFKSNIQATIDSFINNPLASQVSGTASTRSRNIIQNVVVLSTLGSDISDKSVTDLDNYLKSQKGLNKLLEPDAIDVFDSVDSAIGFQNIAFRRRAQILFDGIMMPFFQDKVRPFTPSLNGAGDSDSNYYKYNESLMNLRDEVGKPVYLLHEEKDNISRYTIANIGFERQRGIARQWDEFAQYIPINLGLWSWNRNTFTNPKDFISVADVFSFTGLVNTFERIAHNHHMSDILSRSIIKNNSSNPFVIITSKILTGVGIIDNIRKAGWARLRGSYSIYGLEFQNTSIQKLSNDIVGFQKYLVEREIITWDESPNGNRATFHWDKITDTDQSWVNKYFKAILKYEEILSENTEALNAIRQRAAYYQEEQKAGYQTLGSKYKKTITNSRWNKISKWILPIALTSTIGNMMLGDFMKSTDGASLFSQIRLILGKGVGSPDRGGSGVDSTPGGLLPFNSSLGKMTQSIGWSAFSIYAGWSISQVTRGIDYQLYQGIDIETIREQLDKKKILGNIATDTLSEAAIKINNIMDNGLPLLKGNHFSHFIIGTAAVYIAGGLLLRTIAGGLNALRTVFGLLKPGDSISPSPNLILASQLTSYRNLILNKVKRKEEVSDYSRIGAYMAGNMIDRLPIQEGGETIPTTRVIAKQGPWQIIQFFLAETIKNRTYDAQGKIIDKGISTYTFGIQSSPTLGLNITFSLPVAIDWKANTKSGFAFKKNEEADDVLGYLKMAGSISGSLLMVVGGFIYAFENMANAMGIASNILPWKWLTNTSSDMKLASNTLKTFVKNSDSIFNIIVGFPSEAARAGVSILEADGDFYKELFFNKKYIHSKNILPILSRIAIFSTIGLLVGGFGMDIFSDNEEKIKNTSLLGGIGAAVIGVSLSTILSSIKSNRSIPETTNLITSSVTTPSIPAIGKMRNVGRHIKNVLSRPRVGFFAFSAFYAYLLTDSNFGYSYGIDLDSDGNVTGGGWSRINTVGIYAGLMLGVASSFGDMGLDAKSTLDKYIKIEKELKDARAINPITWYKKYKLNQLKADVNHYIKTVADVYTRTSHDIRIGHSLKAVENLNIEIEKLKKYNISSVEQLIGDPNSEARSSYQKVFANAEYKNAIRSRKPQRLARLTIGFFVFQSAISIAAKTIAGMTVGSYKGQESINAFYSIMESPDQPNWVREGLSEPIANVVRLITGWDKVMPEGDIIDLLHTNSDGRVLQLRKGQKLLEATSPEASNLSRAISVLAAPFLINPMNAYQSVFAGIGVTFRRGEYGLRTNSYLQIQTAGQDISTAVYQMVPSFLYKNAQNAHTLYSYIIENGLYTIMKGAEIATATKAQITQITTLLLTASGKLQPLSASKRRTFSAITTDFGADLVASDPILSMAIQERSRRLTELAYQPTESIMSRMTDPYISSILTGRSKGFTSNNVLSAMGADKILLDGVQLFDSLMHKLNTNNNISIKAFSVYFNKEKARQEREELNADTASEILEDTSSYLNINTSDKNLNWFQRIGHDILAVVGTKLPALQNIGIGFTAALFGVGVFMFTSIANTLLYSSYSNAIYTNADRYKKVLGGLEGVKEGKGFLLRPKLSTFSIKATGDYIITRGDRVFRVSLPDNIRNANGKVLGDSLYNALEEVQVQVISNTKNIIDGISDTSDKGLSKILSRMYDAAYALNPEGFTTPADRVWTAWNKAEFKTNMRVQLEAVIEPKVKASITAFFKTKVSVSGLTNVDEVAFGSLINRQMAGAISNNQESIYIEAETKRVTNQLVDHIISELDSEMLKDTGELLPNQPLWRLRTNNTEEVGSIIVAVIKNAFNKYIEQLDNNLMYLETEPFGYVGRLQHRVLELAGKNQQVTTNPIYKAKQHVSPISSIKSVADSTDLNTLKINPPSGRMTTYSTFKSVGGTLFNYATKSMGILESVDILSAYTQLAQAERTGEYDLELAKDYVGYTTVNSAIGVGISFAGIGAVKALAAATVSFTPVGWGLAALAIIGTAIAGYHFREHISNSINDLFNTKVGKAFTGWIGNSLESIYHNTGQAVYNITDIAGPAQPSLIRFVGMSLAIGALMAILLPISGFATATVAGTTTILNILRVSALAGTAYAAAGSTPIISNGVMQLERIIADRAQSLSKTKYFNWLVGNPELIPYWNRNYFYQPGSPFEAGTAVQIINSHYKEQLNDASDWTGRKSIGLFINPTIYGSDYYSGISDPARDAFGIRPHNMSSPLIDRELAIRAQYYNHAVIGSNTWIRLMKTATNYTALQKYMNRVRPELRVNPEEVSQARQARGEINRDIKRTNEKIAKQKAGEYVAPYVAVVAQMSKRRGLKTNSNEKVNTIISVQRKDINSNYIEQQQYIAYSTYEKAPVISTEVSVNKTNSKRYYVQRGVSNSNDVMREAYIGLEIGVMS